MHLEVAPARQDLLDARRPRRAPRAASCTCARCPRTRPRTTWPVSATAKFAPLTPTGTDRNFARRCARAAAVSSAGSSETSTPSSRAEELGDLGAVAVDGGHEDVRGRVVGELDDELGQVGLHARARRRASRRVVEVDLVGGQRLDLDDLVGAVGAGDVGHDRARPRRRRAPSARCRRRAVTDSSRRSRWTSRWRSARSLISAPASRSASQSGDLGDHPRALVADRRASRGRGCAAAGCRPARRARPRGKPSFTTSSLARISARCIDAHARARVAQAAADVHQAGVVGRGADLGAGVEDAPQLVGQHRRRRVGVLDREGAAEAAALLGVRQLDEVDAAHRAQQPQRRVADLQQPQRVARRVVGHAVRERRADVLDPQPPDEELATARTRAAPSARDLRGERRRRRPRSASARVALAHHRRARPARRDDRLGVAEHAHEAPHERRSPRARSRSWRASARSRSARAGSRPATPTRSSTATVARPVCGNSVSLKQVMKSAARTGASCPTRVLDKYRVSTRFSAQVVLGRDHAAVGRARCARSDPVDVRRRVGDGRGRAVARRRASRPASAPTSCWRR